MNPIKSLTTYLRASKAELEKVTWPTKEETVRYSLLVTVVCIATAAFFAGLDFGFGKGLDAVIDIARPDIAGQALPTHEAPVTPDLQPFVPESGGGIEAVDDQGNPTMIDIETVPLEGVDSSFTITPEIDPGLEQ